MILLAFLHLCSLLMEGLGELLACLSVTADILKPSENDHPSIPQSKTPFPPSPSSNTRIPLVNSSLRNKVWPLDVTLSLSLSSAGRVRVQVQGEEEGAKERGAQKLEGGGEESIRFLLLASIPLLMEPIWKGSSKGRGVMG